MCRPDSSHTDGQMEASKKPRGQHLGRRSERGCISYGTRVPCADPLAHRTAVEYPPTRPTDDHPLVLQPDGMAAVGKYIKVAKCAPV